MIRALLLTAAIAGAPSIAAAQPVAAIADANAHGLIGERYDGYLGVVAADAPAALRHQVAAVNIRRRALYSELAERRGVGAQDVGMTAACQLFVTIAAGQHYLLADNIWRVRLLGEPPLIPGYCRP